MNIRWIATSLNWVLDTVNLAAGRWPWLDEFMRLAAIFGTPVITICAIVLGCCAANPRRRRGVWLAMLGAALALVACAAARHFWYRPRPFLNQQVLLLLGYPNTPSFPSLEMAVAGGLGFGLCAYFKRLRWLVIPLLILTASARLFCGIEYTSDVVAGLLAGALCTLLLIFCMDFHHLPGTPTTKRMIAAAVLIACAAGGVSYLLPRFSPKPHHSTFATRTQPASAEDKNLIRGYAPTTEYRLAQVLAGHNLPGHIRRVTVGDNGYIQVVGIKFSAVTDGRRLPLEMMEREALSIARSTFKLSPMIDEADIWGVIPYRNEVGRVALRTVFSVSARRSQAHFLFQTPPPRITPHQALSRFGVVAYTPEKGRACR